MALNPIIVIAGVICVVGVIVMLLNRAAADSDVEETPEQVRAWEAAMANEQSQVGRVLLGVARPLSKVPTIHDQATSPQYRAIQSKLLAAGGAYGGSVEVFLSVQIVALLAAATFAIGLWFVADGMLLIALGILALAIAYYPWSAVSNAAKKRARAVTVGLPEFAELLQMPLTSGMGIVPALAFTADRQTGPVADEVKNLVRVLKANPIEEARAFLLAGERLGSAEAKAFFAALMQAHIEGARVAKNLESQADSLRVAAHQQARADIKKLPVKLVFIFALHFIISLFAVILVPTFISFSQL